VQVAEGVPVIDGGVPIPVEDCAYDEEGNRSFSHLSAFYSSNGHNQLLEDDAFLYAYDDRGNRVSKTSKADGSVESYAYDALDRRITKVVDGTTEAFVYDTSVATPLRHDNIVLEFETTDPSVLTRSSNLVDA
jgi:outer membrane lipoprotein-sorting protein